MSTFLVLFVAVFSFLAPTAAPSAAQHPTALELAAESTAVFRGFCTKSVARWDEQRRMIMTDTIIRASEYIKGDLGALVTITEPGGDLPELNLAMTVPHVARFKKGEEVIVFVWTDPRGVHRVVGGDQGKYPITRNAETGAKQVGRLPLDAFIQTLRSSLMKP